MVKAFKRKVKGFKQQFQESLGRASCSLKLFMKSMNILMKLCLGRRVKQAWRIFRLYTRMMVCWSRRI